MPRGKLFTNSDLRSIFGQVSNDQALVEYLFKYFNGGAVLRIPSSSTKEELVDTLDEAGLIISTQEGLGVRAIYSFFGNTTVAYQMLGLSADFMINYYSEYTTTLLSRFAQNFQRRTNEWLHLRPMNNYEFFLANPEAPRTVDIVLPETQHFALQEEPGGSNDPEHEAGFSETQNNVGPFIVSPDRVIQRSDLLNCDPVYEETLIGRSIGSFTEEEGEVFHAYLTRCRNGWNAGSDITDTSLNDSEESTAVPGRGDVAQPPVNEEPQPASTGGGGSLMLMAIGGSLIAGMLLK